MKVLETIKSVLLSLIGIIFFAFALLMTILVLYHNDFGVTEFGSTSVIIVDDDIETNVYKKNDIVLVKKMKVSNINKGDEIFAYSVDASNTPHINVGIVGETYVDENAISYENGDTFSDNYIIGKQYKTISKLGLILAIVESKWGFFFLILIPGFLIFIYELYELILEIKYGKE